MLRTTTSIAALAALLATGAYAQTTTETEVETELEQGVEEGAQAVQEGAEAVAEETEEAVDDAGKALEDAGDAVEAEAEGEVVEVEPAEGDAVDAETVVVEPAEGDEVVVETTEPEIPEGTPVEGQIFEQSVDTFLASTLLGANVLSAEGEDVGEVTDMILGADGSVEGVVVGVGGFLGLGEKDVAVEFGSIQVRQEPDGDTLSFVLNATEEELDAAPQFRTRADVEAQAEADAALQDQPGATALEGDDPDAVIVEEPADEAAPAIDN